MLLTENYTNRFEFVKIIVQNMLTRISENGIFDDVTSHNYVSTIRSDMLIRGQSFLTF